MHPQKSSLQGVSFFAFWMAGGERGPVGCTSYENLSREREMAEVLVKFDEAIADESGNRYFAQAAGRERDDGLWEGWLEFLPTLDTGEALASERETTQPNRVNLKYWAEGLTRIYLEGALQRAIAIARQHPVKGATGTEASRFEAGATRTRVSEHARDGERIVPHAVLDPYSVYSQGEDILRSELGALSRSHIESIVKAYGFPHSNSPADLASTSEQTLIDAIVEGVRSKEATNR
jgi:hypothetical protein